MSLIGTVSLLVASTSIVNCTSVDRVSSGEEKITRLAEEFARSAGLVLSDSELRYDFCSRYKPIESPLSESVIVNLVAEFPGTAPNPGESENEQIRCYWNRFASDGRLKSEDARCTLYTRRLLRVEGVPHDIELTGGTSFDTGRRIAHFLSDSVGQVVNGEKLLLTDVQDIRSIYSQAEIGDGVFYTVAMGPESDLLTYSHRQKRIEIEVGRAGIRFAD